MQKAGIFCNLGQEIGANAMYDPTALEVRTVMITYVGNEDERLERAILLSPKRTVQKVPKIVKKVDD